MKKTLKLLLGLSLLLGPVKGEEAPQSQPQPQTRAWSVYVNGVRSGANSLQLSGVEWFDAQQLVSALGYRLQVLPQGCFINGQPLPQPVITVGGMPYTTPEAVAKAVGASVQRDPVRTSVFYQLSASNPAGIPYYSADYVTPEEEYKRQRRKDLSMAPGDVMLEEWDAKMAEEWKRKHPHLTYVPRAPDYAQIQFDPNEMPRMMTQEELENPVTYREQRPVAQPTGYLERTANNGVFAITITDVKLAEALKGMKPPLLPEPGKKFLVVHLTFENVSKVRQRPGWFNMRDQNGLAYPANSLYSKFPQGEMQTREKSVGFLIFEIPVQAQPTSLEAMVTPALNLSLIYR